LRRFGGSLLLLDVADQVEKRLADSPDLALEPLTSCVRQVAENVRSKHLRLDFEQRTPGLTQHVPPFANGQTPLALRNVAHNADRRTPYLCGEPIHLTPRKRFRLRIHHPHQAKSKLEDLEITKIGHLIAGEEVIGETTAGSGGI
jgi:hypothetical protein